MQILKINVGDVLEMKKPHPCGTKKKILHSHSTHSIFYERLFPEEKSSYFLGLITSKPQ